MFLTLVLYLAVACYYSFFNSCSSLTNRRLDSSVKAVRIRCYFGQSRLLLMGGYSRV
jgi:hypothetical protein